MRRRIAAVGAVIVAAGAGLSGCGSSGPQTQMQRDVAVIRGWSAALQRGDVNGAARYFALPSLFINGPGLRIRTRRDARAVNASLPCGAKFVSATRQGRYINVLFTLTGRPGVGGTSCGSGVGQMARTDFLISHGKIAAWIRAPTQPQAGAPGSAPNPAPTPTTQGPPVAV